LPGLRLLRAREASAFESEELRLDQLIWQRRAVDGNEWSMASWRRCVDEARDNFLSRAGFALQTRGNVGRRDTRRAFEDVAPRFRCADEADRGLRIWYRRESLRQYGSTHDSLDRAHGANPIGAHHHAMGFTQRAPIRPKTR
jgi:hypothetical protein